MTTSTVKFRTSKRAEDAFRSLHKKTGLAFNILCRLAWARSLRERSPLDLSCRDVTGQEFNRYSVVGEYDGLVKALTAQAAGERLSDDEFLGHHFKAHVDRGVLLLDRDYEEAGSLDAFWSLLLENLPPANRSITTLGVREAKPINIHVGDEIGTMEPVMCGLNTATNPHMAIIGIPGSGKTQFAKKILADIRTGHPNVNFLFFDYAKGDVAGDEEFVKITRAEVYQLPRRMLPINPFMLPSYDQTSIRFSAEEKMESINNLEHLGPVQQGLLSRAIEAAYAERSGDNDPFPDFEIVAKHLRLAYEQSDRTDDTLTQLFRKLTTFNLFPPIAARHELLESLVDRTMIIDLHELPALRELVTFLVIERLYRELKAMPEAPVDPETKARELRTLLVIDEAHNYLPMNNKFLEKLIREMRSKGLAVVLLSQSPDDFDQKHFDYTELLEFVYVMKCTATRPQHIQKLIRCRPETAKALAPRLANLPYPECFTQPRTRAGGEYTHMKAGQFHQAYKQ